MGTTQRCSQQRETESTVSSSLYLLLTVPQVLGNLSEKRPKMMISPVSLRRVLLSSWYVPDSMPVSFLFSSQSEVEISDSLYETKAEALPQPNLMVDRLVITETDSVTLNCSTSPDVSVSRCDFYIANEKMSADSSCVETVTGTKLLSMAKIRSPAEVKVKCSYSVKDGAVNITSSDSISTTITINSE
ncbi:hypothetical protein AMECASPLE_031080 [Ameca splendens]|uniref:Ig-like domain-containing protein n=1 Tax=Ameca splendens TaxID=208324 RepID=A0ABV0ZFW0_9TELE